MINWRLLAPALAGGLVVVWLLRRRAVARPAARPRRFWRNLLAVGGVALLLALLSGYVSLAYTRAQWLVHPARVPVDSTFDDEGVENYESVTFTTSDGLQLHGWYVRPQNGATIVFVHGFGSNRTGMLADAALQIEHGYGALVFDLRNSGESQGDTTTLGYLETEDVRAAVEYVQSRPEGDPARIGLLGHSMGGATVIRAAARIPVVQAVVAESAFTSLEDEVGVGLRAVTGLPPFPFAPLVIWFGEQEAGLDIGQVRPLDDIPAISPRAVLLVHGALDPTVPPAHAEQLYAAALEPKELYMIPNAGHGGFPQAEPEEYVRRVVGFFNQYLLR